MLKLLLILTGKPYLNLAGPAHCYKPRSKSFQFNLSSKEHPGVEQQKGQSLLELAIFLPVLFILLLAMIYTGLCLDQKMKLEAIAREATRVVDKTPVTARFQLDWPGPKWLPGSTVWTRQLWKSRFTGPMSAIASPLAGVVW
jgi:hypothetical protein